MTIEIDGEQRDVNAGLFIMNQFMASGEAWRVFREAHEDVDDSAEDFSWEGYELDGVEYLEWINNRALELTAKIFAAEEMFKAQGLSFTAAEMTEFSEHVDARWNTDRIFEQLYAQYEDLAYQIHQPGMGESWGTFFENVGVSKESFRQYNLAEEQRAKLFESIYGVDGTNPVSDEEWKEIFVRDYARVRVLEISTLDVEGEELEDEALEELTELAQQLLEQIEQGGSFADARMAYTAFLAQLDLPTEPTDSDPTPTDSATDTATDTEPPTDPEASTPTDSATDTATSEPTAEPTETTEPTEANEPTETTEPTDTETDDETFDLGEEVDLTMEIYIPIHGDSLASEIYAHIAEMELDAPEIYETDGALLIILRLDVLGNEKEFEKHRDIIVVDLKADEFEELFEVRAKEMLKTIIVVNQAAFERYDPRKFTH
jgi:hypothetical protein